MLFSIIHIISVFISNGYLYQFSSIIIQNFSCIALYFWIQNFLSLGGHLTIITLLLFYHSRVLNDSKSTPDNKKQGSISKLQIAYLSFLWISGVFMGIPITLLRTNSYNPSIGICDTNNFSWFATNIWSMFNILLLLIIEIYEELKHDEKYRKTEFQPIRYILISSIMCMMTSMILKIFQTNIFIWTKFFDTILAIFSHFLILYLCNIYSITWKSIRKNRSNIENIMNNYQAYDVEIKNIRELLYSVKLTNEFLKWCILQHPVTLNSQSKGKITFDISKSKKMKDKNLQTQNETINDDNEEMKIQYRGQLTLNPNHIVQCFYDINNYLNKPGEDIETHRARRNAIVETYIKENSDYFISASSEIQTDIMKNYLVYNKDSLQTDMFDGLKEEIIDRFQEYWIEEFLDTILTEQLVIQYYDQLDSEIEYAYDSFSKNKKPNFYTSIKSTKWNFKKFKKSINNKKSNSNNNDHYSNYEFNEEDENHKNLLYEETELQTF